MTETAGTSMFGLESIPRLINDIQPTTDKTRNRTNVGTGFLIDQAEMLKDIRLLNVERFNVEG